MKKFTRYYKRLRISFIRTAFFMIIVNIFFLPYYIPYEPDGENYFSISLNGLEVGHCGKDTNIEELLREARLAAAKESEDIMYVETNLAVEGKEVMFAEIDSDSSLRERMTAIIQDDSTNERLQHAYTIKIKNYTINLASSDEVKEVLQASLDQYEDNRRYTVDLVMNPAKELNSLTAVVKDNAVEEVTQNPFPDSGFEALVEEALATVEADDGRVDFSDIEYGLTDLTYGDAIEVVDTYLMADQITPVEEAIAQITSVEEKNAIYEVQEGDTLSQIAETVNIDMDKIISLNDEIENELSIIRVGQEIIITQPEPPLSVERKEQVYYEEEYDEEIIYVDNDEWYTTQEKTLQEPSAGFRKVAALVSYRNEKEVSREIIKEEIVMQAVPKIVERGTKIPPSYIKPISGGRLSSSFGRRSAPTKGASTYHKGVDWAVPRGTAVYASSGGTVTKAGWGSGYGYVVYIRHPDGRETRYAHLNKVLVSAGQTVKQGQKIALSGNTGRSTGPHLHFELRINGTAVNPLKYLD